MPDAALFRGRDARGPRAISGLTTCLAGATLPGAVLLDPFAPIRGRPRWHATVLISTVAIRISLAATLLACAGEAQGESSHAEPPPASVDVAEITEGPLSVTRVYLGEVRALARAELAVGASGEVQSVAVREGDRVAQGDLLLSIDPDLARAQLEAARAAGQATRTQGEQASRDAERLGRAGPQMVAELEIERAATQAAALQAQSVSLRAEERQARESLARHRVIAPFAGVIARRMVDPGDWVSAGTPVLELVADGRVEVLARVEPDVLTDLAIGTTARIQRGERTVDGHVVGIVPALDPTTRTAQVRLLVDETPSWLLAGSTAEVRFDLSREGDGVLVPRDAIVEGVAASRVVTVVDGHAHLVGVEIVERGAERVRVRGEGLTAGAVVVTRGNERLRPDQPVAVTE